MSTGLQLAHNNVLAEALKQGFQSFVPQYPNAAFAPSLSATTTTGTPASGKFYSTITNRASMADISQDLRALMGIDRIMTQAISPINTEMGPNGEPVWICPNDTNGQIRYVGTNWSNNADTSGQYIIAPSGTSGDYVEVTFCGTGLNMLFMASTYTTYDLRVSVDGGAEGSNIMSASASTVLQTRNYSTNQVLPVVSGLSYGIHTVKIRNAVLTSTNHRVYGYEVLNLSSSITVNPGSAYIDLAKTSLLAQQSIAYNSTFESGTLGTRGGRAVIYLKQDGTIAKAVTPTNTSSAFLTSADHTNEDIVRVHHYAEFGAGRADDFSIIGSTANAARAFTLDDGTTTLTADSVSQAVVSGLIVGLVPTTTNNYLSITFVGTGLDIVSVCSVSGAIDNYAVTVDGVSTGLSTTNATLVAGQKYTEKIASGLPYGTHTVKFLKNPTGAGGAAIQQFRIYQPKKPTVPTGALELADYCILADYVGTGITGTTAADNSQVATGVLTKMNIRELTYVGANWSPTLDTGNFVPSGFQLSPGANNSQSYSYTFFGTGFVLHNGSSSGGTFDFTVTIDGSLSATGVARSNASNLGAGSYRSTSSTQDLPCRVEFTGLALGLHTVTVVRTAGPGNFNFLAAHIITPIHAVKINTDSDLQNSLPIGSCAISDSRKFTLLKDSSASTKTWAQAAGITSSPTTTSTTFVPCPDMSVTHTNKSGRIKVSYVIDFIDTSGRAAFQIYIDGVGVGTQKRSATSNIDTTQVDILKVPVSPGVHKVDVYWNNDGAGTTTASGVERNLLVEEV